MWLKQSTSVVVSFGPFLDKTDGVTLEVALVSAIDHATTGAMLSKNGGALTIRSQAVTASTYDARGDYRLTLSTTDTNTLGTLRMIFEEAATCLPVWQDFMVVPANVWDSLFGADALQVDLVEWLGTAAATPTVAGVPEVDLTHVAGATTNVAALATNVDAILTDTGTTLQAELDGIQTDTEDIQTRLPAALVSGRIDASVGAMAAAVVTAAAIADAAIDRATFAADTGLQSARSNTAQAGAASEITLDASASAVDDFYNDMVVYLTGGTGVGQARLISDYAGATKVATIVPNWVTNPDATTTFATLPFTRVDAALWLGVAMAALQSGRVDSFTGAMDTGVITNVVMADNAIDNGALADGAISNAKFALNAIANSTLNAGAISAAKFAAGAIDAAAIAADAITAAKIADGAIDAATFAAGALDAVWAVAGRTLTAFDASFKTGYALSAAGIQAV